MKFFNKGDRVVVSSNWKALGDYWMKAGMKGTVVSQNGEIVHVDWDGNPYIPADDSGSINQYWLDLVKDDQPKVTYRIVGPKGSTECLNETMVKGLVAAGILVHTETHVHDDETVKIYRTESLFSYKVKDFRSTSKSLEEQFPKDN